MSEEEPLFTVSNHHMTGTLKPPRITDAEPNYYRGYFENAHGEQAIFVHNRATNESDLFLGDVGWKRFRVTDRNVEGLILNEEEVLWLRACCRAANVSSST
jgi:hypothetical protein